MAGTSIRSLSNHIESDVERDLLALIPEAERLQARWWAAFREVVIELGAKIVYPFPDSIDVELPDGWTQEAFFAEVDRRAGVDVRL
jgi:hypothetical protein